MELTKGPTVRQDVQQSKSNLQFATMPKETNFSQSTIAREMSSVNPSYRAGVCRVLATQWMFLSHTNGQCLDEMWFYRVGVGDSQLKMFVDLGMRAEREVLFKVCRLHPFPAKTFTDFTAAIKAIAGDSANDAYYYLKLEWGGDGHAIGVKVTGRGCGLFDPNEKEVVEIPTTSALHGELGALILEHYLFPKPSGYEVQKLVPMGPRWMAARPGARNAPRVTMGRH